MRANLTKPAYLEQNPLATTESVDYTEHIGWLIWVGFDQRDVLRMVMKLQAAQQRAGGESCG